MAVEFKGALANLVKKTEFVVVSVEDESSEENDVLRIEIKDKITVTGSNPLPNGGAMRHEDNIIYVAGEDVSLFQKGCQEVDGQTIYSGSLKMDVSKPKFRTNNGVTEVVKAAKLWLTSVKFNKKGNALRADSRDAGRNALLKLFGQPVQETVLPASRQNTTAKAEVTAEEEINA